MRANLYEDRFARGACGVLILGVSRITAAGLRNFQRPRTTTAASLNLPGACRRSRLALSDDCEGTGASAAYRSLLSMVSRPSITSNIRSARVDLLDQLDPN